jgi:ubiquinone/menaquinone biosynthesis C-methylase UbiE
VVDRRRSKCVDKSMQSKLSPAASRSAYFARQIPRLLWYVGHGYVMSRLAEDARRQNGNSKRPQNRTSAPVPDRQRLYRDMAALFRTDLANVEAGLYPLPRDRDGSLLTLLDRSGLFFQDLPRVHRRRQAGEHTEVLNEQTRGRRPNYYLQNFHFQTGGWMTEDSAKRYDLQVEVLFYGTANAIRRQALPPLCEAFAGRDQRRLRLLDVGCGTGRFLNFVKQCWPRLPCIGLDMSESYLREARRHLKGWSWLKLVVGNGEMIPVPDASQDAVTNVFMVHELPSKVRRAVFRELARVLKPGGRLIILDSLQRGDEPDYDGLLQMFPQNFHEPYYSEYLKEDFATLAEESGLRYTRSEKAFVSKAMVFDKP